MVDVGVDTADYGEKLAVVMIYSDKFYDIWNETSTYQSDSPRSQLFWEDIIRPSKNLTFCSTDPERAIPKIFTTNRMTHKDLTPYGQG